MTHVLIRHEVEDFNKWKTVFDADADSRTETGMECFKVYQEEGSPNTVFAIFKWDTLENAKAFIENPELKEKMKEAGVKEENMHVHYLNKVDSTKC